MKKFKKIFAALAASALVAAMSFTSMAASITINSGLEKDEGTATTYTYYQMLKASVSGDNVSYYVETSELKTAIEGLTSDLDDDGHEEALFAVSEKTADGSRWNVTPSDELKALITSNSDAAAKKIAAAFETIKGKAINSNTFNIVNKTANSGELEEGYYLVESPLGTVLAVDTLKDVEITEKNEYPRDDKKVAENSVITGRNITYYITVDVPASVIDNEKITVHDKFADLLSFNAKSVQVYSDDTKDDSDTSSTGINVNTSVEELANKSFDDLSTEDFTLKTDDNADGCTFEVEIKNLDKYKNKSIVFRYTAQLDDTAQVGPEYLNEEHLTYTKYSSNVKQVPVKTYDFNLIKTFSDSDEATGLKADFTLYRDTDNNNELNIQNDEAMKLYRDSTGYVASNRGTNYTITANKGTKLNIRGLSEGTYYLVETSTSAGYNLLAKEVKINIAADGKVSADGKEATDKTVTVNNEKGLRLPSTGGMGTTVFAIVGLLVMAGAAVTLIVKKRA